MIAHFFRALFLLETKMLIRPLYPTVTVSALPSGTKWVECYNREGKLMSKDTVGKLGTASFSDLPCGQWFMFVALHEKKDIVDKTWSKVYGIPRRCEKLTAQKPSKSKNNIGLHWTRPEETCGDKIRYYRIMISDETGGSEERDRHYA